MKNEANLEKKVEAARKSVQEAELKLDYWKKQVSSRKSNLKELEMKAYQGLLDDYGMTFEELKEFLAETKSSKDEEGY